jgi:hypothetical protein
MPVIRHYRGRLSAEWTHRRILIIRHFQMQKLIYSTMNALCSGELRTFRVCNAQVSFLPRFNFCILRSASTRCKNNNKGLTVYRCTRCDMRCLKDFANISDVYRQAVDFIIRSRLHSSPCSMTLFNRNSGFDLALPCAAIIRSPFAHSATEYFTSSGCVSKSVNFAVYCSRTSITSIT